MLIEVSREDIELGEPMVADRCPLSRALQRSLNVPKVYVHLNTWSTDGYDRRNLPAEAIDFLNRFDFGCCVSPFTFEVDYEVCA